MYREPADGALKCAVACHLGLMDAAACALQPMGGPLQQRAREDLARAARDQGDPALGELVNALNVRCDPLETDILRS